MADEPVIIDPEAVGNNTEDVLKVVFSKIETTAKAISDMLSKVGTEGSKSIVGSFSSGLTAIDEIMEKTLNGAKLVANMADIGTNAAKAFANTVKESTKDIELNSLLVEVGLDTDSLKKAMQPLEDMANNPEFAVKFAAYFVIDQATQKMDQLGAQIEILQGKFLKFDREGLEVIRDMPGLFTSQDLKDGLNNYKNQIISTVQDLGIAPDQARAAFKELSNSLNPDQIQALGGAADSAGKKMDGLTRAYMISKSTGLELTAVGESLNKMTRTLGMSADTAARQFEMFQNVQKGTGMRISQINETIMGASDHLKFYGNNVEGVAATFKGFLGTLGKGREELAKPMVNAMAQSIEKMPDAMRAFLGMTTSIGTGGGGAIGGMLQTEEALATGEGMEKVLSGVKESIERLSGSPILTRKEAIDTGQETQYYKQRKLMETQLGIQGAGQQDMAMKFLQEKDTAGLRQQLRGEVPTAAGRGESRGEMALGLEVGGMGAFNRTKLVSEVAAQATSAAFLEVAKSLDTGATVFNKSIDKFAKLMDATTPEQFKGELAKMSGESGQRRAEEFQAEKANQAKETGEKEFTGKLDVVATASEAVSRNMTGKKGTQETAALTAAVTGAKGTQETTALTAAMTGIKGTKETAALTPTVIDMNQKMNKVPVIPNIEGKFQAENTVPNFSRQRQLVQPPDSRLAEAQNTVATVSQGTVGPMDRLNIGMARINDQKKSNSALGAEGPTNREFVVTLKAEAGPDGFINIVPIIEGATEKIITEKIKSHMDSNHGSVNE